MSRATTRPYLSVQIGPDALDPVQLETQFRRLHRLLASTDATLEMLLCSTAHETVDCYVGITPTAHFESLRTIVRTLLPETDDLTEKQCEPLEAIHPPTSTPESPSSREYAAVEYQATPTRQNDWQLGLTPFADFQSEETPRIPLGSLVSTMAQTDANVVFQALVEAEPDWSHKRDERRLALESAHDTIGQQFLTALVGSSETTDEDSLQTDRERDDALESRDPRHCVSVTARALCTSDFDDPGPIAQELTGVFAPVSGPYYEIAGTVVDDPRRLVDDALDRTTYSPYPPFSAKFPLTSNTTKAILADPSELASFCLLDGTALPADAKRALEVTNQERTALSRPPEPSLTSYHTDGMTLGHPLTEDDAIDPDPVSLPPSLQRLHLAWFGRTGSGKTTSLINAILDNHAATEGADILIDPKGDGMPQEYLEAHYERFGTLENVLYFDCAQTLPALSFFDIRRDLEAGISRASAVEDRVDHYVEILTQIMGPDRFSQAVRSPDIIRYLTKALFDPVSGDDAFAHRNLHTAVQRMHDRQSAPPVSDDDLERMLAGVVANRARTFDELMQGVANRIEKIPINPRLARIFNHVPERADEQEESEDEAPDPHFDFADVLDEDVVIILDTGGLRNSAQRALALVLLSNLWSALKRRAKENAGQGVETNDEPPLVNLYIEEAASLAVTSLLSDLLAQSRGFDCSVTLAMQFPAQLRAASERAYNEVMNNVSTIVTGNVAVDDDLTMRFATEDMSRRAVGNRLRALRRGQWFVSLPAAFDETEPSPFLIRSASPPPSIPTEWDRGRFESAYDDARQRIQRNYALELVEPSTAETDDDDEEDEDVGMERVDSALPYTNRMPPTVAYVPSIHGLRCSECDSHYDPDIEGMKRAIECSGSLESVATDDIPVCELNLKLSNEERGVSEYSDGQLLFLQAVYNAQQLRYDPLEYDLLHDSMIRLQEYVDVESEAIEDLVDDGLLTHDTDRPQRLYSVTPDGRSEIGEQYRKGVDYGHGVGDLEETSQHVLAVEVGRQYLEAHYVDDDESPVVEVVPYFELEGNDTAVAAASAMGGDPDQLQEEMDEYKRSRIDVVGLDEEGSVRVTIEAERINHDLRRAAPEDFDKMAACDPDEALWVTMSHSEGHEILAALNEPLEGEPRVEKTYAQSTPVGQFRIDEPGCTGFYTVEQMRDLVDEAE
ncbi:TraG/TraD/VirD4 family enzyme, ATPase [Halomicrobium sp. LC1Hm]|nr:TraG/TraD/VirD4 family enzyme, ATPase [Halomicrobium sp. LC1Hm]